MGTRIYLKFDGIIFEFALAVVLQEKCENLEQLFPKITLLAIPELFLILFTTKYSKNYLTICILCIYFKVASHVYSIY